MYMPISPTTADHGFSVCFTSLRIVTSACLTFEHPGFPSTAMELALGVIYTGNHIGENMFA